MNPQVHVILSQIKIMQEKFVLEYEMRISFQAILATSQDNSFKILWFRLSKHCSYRLWMTANRITNWVKSAIDKIFSIMILMLHYAAYAWTVNMPLVTQSQIWNAKHKKAKWTWVGNMDIGSFNQSEAQILCSRFVLHNKSNKIFTLETRVIEFPVPFLLGTENYPHKK